MTTLYALAQEVAVRLPALKISAYTSSMTIMCMQQQNNNAEINTAAAKNAAKLKLINQSICHLLAPYTNQPIAAKSYTPCLQWSSQSSPVCLLQASLH